ncbi:MAG: DUF3460 family protein [Georgfuchsia sp.]
MAKYESEYTKFMREWKQSHLEQAEVAQKGWSLWWNKEPRDQESMRRDLESRVPQKSYYYDAN